MKTIRFIERPDMTYGCDTPGDQSGEYVRAEVAKELLEACEESLDLLTSAEAEGWKCRGKAAAIRQLRAAIAAARGE